MKKTFLASLVALLLIGAASPASALSITDIQAQIQSLVARVAELQAQIKQMGAGASVPTSPSQAGATPAALPRICSAAYARSLSVGTSGDEVKALQELLKSQGLLEANATGYFGTLTQVALQHFQSENDVVSSGSANTTGFGIAGPRTWDAIRKWCQNPFSRFSVNPQKGIAPLTVTFQTNVRLSNPGMVADAGDYKIVFGDGSEHIFSCGGSSPWCDGPHVVAHTYAADGVYTARLVHFGFYGPAEQSVDGVIIAERKVTVGSSVSCSQEYAPVCASKQIVCITTPCNPIPQTYNNRCTMSADGATFLYEGQCRADVDPSLDRTCKAWYDGCNNCARETADSAAACTLRACFAKGPSYCTAHFENTTNNKPPSVSGFSGPTALAINEAGTWALSVTDPEGGALSYRIIWGDEGYAQSSAASSASDTLASQNTTFTHTYTTAGMFTVSITVRDSAGNEAKASATVQVSASVTACTLEYAPICGQPPEPACRHSLPACMIATPGPQTYSNRCFLNAANATFLYSGECATSQY